MYKRLFHSLLNASSVLFRINVLYCYWYFKLKFLRIFLLVFYVPDILLLLVFIYLIDQLNKMEYFGKVIYMY